MSVYNNIIDFTTSIDTSSSLQYINQTNDDRVKRIHRNRLYHYLLEQLRKNMYVYSTASEYYRRLNLKITLPCLFIGSIASILSFVSTSSIVSSTDKDIYAMSVGILASISTLVQSIGNSVGFATRNELFEKGADEYAKLIIKVEFEMLAPNEEFQEFFNNIESEINKIKQSCKYFPPQFIIDDYMKNKHKIDKFDDDSTLREIVIN